MGAKRLSLLIPTLNNRSKLCERLTSKIIDQLTTEVEMMLLPDNGEKTIGEKRNALLDAAIGDYVAFIDDDDMISDDYIEQVMTALEGNPDCASLNGFIYTPEGKKRLFTHSIKHDGWYTKDDVDFRTPNHINAIRRELAVMVGFPELNHGEDHQFSKEIRKYLTTEGEAPGVIYHYYPSSEFKSPQPTVKPKGGGDEAVD